MRATIARRGLAVAGATLIALALAGGPAAAASASGTAGQQLWASQYAGPDGDAYPNAEAVSPADGTVLVAGADDSLDGASSPSLTPPPPAPGSG